MYNATLPHTCAVKLLYIGYDVFHKYVGQPVPSYIYVYPIEEEEMEAEALGERKRGVFEI